MMADVVSRENELSREVIFSAIEQALAMATRKLHTEEIEVHVKIDRETGSYESFRVWEVLEADQEVEFPERQISLAEAGARQPGVTPGEWIEQPLDDAEFGRIAAQAAKQVIMQKVREARREQIAERYQHRFGELLSGTIKRVERGYAIVDLGDAEGRLPRSEMIPKEGLRVDDRIRVMLKTIDGEARGPQLILTRLSPEFLMALFSLEVPEVGEGLIEILGAARDCGSRAKIAVRSHDNKIDPVGACVGIRGSRVQSVSNEIAGERIDIIVWSENISEFAIRALAPAEIESIIVDEEKKSIDVIVREENLSRAIGRGGQNVRLASELLGWELNLMTDEESQERERAELVALVEYFRSELRIDENVANILIQEGFTTLDHIVYVPQQELLRIEEFDAEMVDELRNRARDLLLAKAMAGANAEPAEDLLAVKGMDEALARELAENDIVTLQDLADASVDEIQDVIAIDDQRVADLIMAARESSPE